MATVELYKRQRLDDRIGRGLTGVYKIENLVNGRVYVGSAAKCIERRTAAHVNMLRRGDHPNVILQRSWHKHGESKFEISLLETCSPESCLDREQYWMDRLEAHTNGYNICPIAGSRFGTAMSDETKLKISERKKGTKLTDETRSKMSKSQKGKTFTNKTRSLLRKNHWAYGPRAEEIRNRIAHKNSGVVFSDQRRANISAGRRRKARTES